MRFHSHQLLILMLLLAACSGGEVRDTLGLNKNAPDEFTVVSRPALSVPPEFDLRPPVPGAPPRQPSTADQARATLLGTEVKPEVTPESIEEPKVETAVTPVIQSEAPSEAASSLLKRAGADTAKEDIRQQLGEDAATPVDTSKATSLYEKLTGAEKNEPVVDPKKEAERLRTNKGEGKPANEGEVPVEDVKPPSVLDRVF